MEQMDFSIEVSESEIEKFADYLYQKENAKATINKYMADGFFFLNEVHKKILMENIDTMEQILQKNKKNLSYL